MIVAIFKGVVWAAIKPIIRQYLQDRALVLPSVKRAEIARRLGISVDVAAAYEEAVRNYALSQFDAIKV